MQPNLDIMRELISFTMERAIDYKTFTGCFIVKSDKVLVREITSIEVDNNCLQHAELKAIASASSLIGVDLGGCHLYTTQKPCVMCASGIAWSGINQVFYGIATNCHWEKETDINNFLGRFNIGCVGRVLENDCKKIDEYLIENGI